jgi:hypothetical protein
MIYYLKFEDKQSMWEALEAVGLAIRDYDSNDERNKPTDEDEWEPTGSYEWIFTGEDLDVIGVIYNKTGNTLVDENGSEYEEMVPTDGYHANLISSKPIVGLPTVSEPKTPHRKIAGV